jgi:hypothetical protein
LFSILPANTADAPDQPVSLKTDVLAAGVIAASNLLPRFFSGKQIIFVATSRRRVVTKGSKGKC